MGLRDIGRAVGELGKRAYQDAVNCARQFRAYLIGKIPEYRQAILDRDGANSRLEREVRAAEERVDRQYQTSLQMRLAENKRLEEQFAKRKAELEGIIGLQRGIIADYRESYREFAVSMLRTFVMRKIPVALVDIKSGEVVYQTPYLRKKIGNLESLPEGVICSVPDKQHATINNHAHNVYSFPIVPDGSMNADYGIILITKSRIPDIQVVKIIENARRILAEANKKLQERTRRFLGEGGLGVNPQPGS